MLFMCNQPNVFKSIYNFNFSSGVALPWVNTVVLLLGKDLCNLYVEISNNFIKLILL